MNNNISALLKQLLHYGATTTASYAALLVGTYALSHFANVNALVAYAISLTFVYVAVFYSYSHFVFKTGMTRDIAFRFLLFLGIFWFVNNAFFWTLYDVAHIPYPLVIMLNLVVLGGIRFYIQRTLVFRVVHMHKRRAALSFDVELWNEGAWMQPYIKDYSDDGGFSDSIIELLNVLNRYQYHATFFVTKTVVDRFPHVVMAVAEQGHEIGVHGVMHNRLHEVRDREAFRAELHAMCDAIETIAGTRPKGFRAPHFSLDESTRWVLPLLHEAGFIYDSSVFPAYTPEYGLPQAPLVPYRVSLSRVEDHDTESPLLEIPVAVAAVAGARIPVGGGFYFRILPLRIFQALLGVTEGIPLLYFHPHELYAGTPRVKGPLLRTGLKYWGTKRALGKFERLCEHVTFDTIYHTYLLKS